MQDLEHSLDLIYEAAFMPDGWEVVLNNMARAIGAEGAVLFNTRAANTRWRASHGIMDLITRILEEDWTRNNPRAQQLLSEPHHGFQNEAEHFTEEQYNEYPFYKDLMQPLGYGFGAGTAILIPSGDNVVFSVERRRSADPINRASIRFLDQLRPHLARAALVSSRLEFEKLQVAVEALRLTGLPSAALGVDGQVLACNTLLESFTPQITLAARDRVRFDYAPANSHFAAVIQELGKPNASMALASRSFPLPAIDDVPPALVHLVPIRGGARDIFSQGTAFLIVTPVDRTRIPSAEAIQGLFDLSPAEARVARCIASGADVAATARRLSLSQETIRSHIKKILAKSGMARQADFVAAIASIRLIP